MVIMIQILFIFFYLNYATGIQDKLGLLNNGVVYAVYDYESQNQDELSFKNGNCIQVLRKGDDQETEWWWSKIGDKEGYIPRNLLGVCCGSLVCLL